MALADHSTFAVAICACSRTADSRPVGLRDTAKVLWSDSLCVWGHETAGSFFLSSKKPVQFLMVGHFHISEKVD